MNARIKNPALAGAICLIVVGFATLEDWYQKYEYPSDAISYLDLSNAIRQGDWAQVLSPYWSLGYPLILAAARPIFPAGPVGEWTSVHVANLVIFVATYLSFLYFLRVATTFLARATGEAQPGAPNGFVLAVGTATFMIWNVNYGEVSRITPDTSVTGIFFLLTATSLEFCLRPTATTAQRLGLLAGLAYLTKAIMLPISMVVLGVVLIHTLARATADRWPTLQKLAWALPAAALIAGPWIAALSLTLGHFTLGESGSLNYAWMVNGLARWHWQGGPEPFGLPIHPTSLVHTNPSVFTFPEPFHVTYPPWYNAYYWYEGYHQSFNLHNQLVSIKYNFLLFSEFLFNTPHSPVKLFGAIAALAAATFLLKDPRPYWIRLRALWPIYVPSLASIGIYLLIFIEARYVAVFLTIVLITLWLPLFTPSLLISKRFAYGIGIILIIVCAASLITGQENLFRRAFRHESCADNSQWKIGAYLVQTGAYPGEKAAFVRVEHTTQTTWAHVAGLHIVGEIGNLGFGIEPQVKDFQLFVSSPDVQETVFDLFRRVGAQLVVVLDVDGVPQGAGWEHVPGTQSWVHRL